MRQVGGAIGTRKVISATPRQLESLIRLAEARARVRFSHDVSPEDVHEAVRLMKVAMQQAATDPRTGTIDMELITTGQAASERAQLREIGRQVLEALGSAERRQMRRSDLLSAVNAASSRELSLEDLQRALDQLQRDESVVVASSGAGGRRDPLVIMHTAV